VCEDRPASVTQALVQLQAALDYLNASDAASEPGPVQAQVLRELERAESRHTAARARYLAAFTAQAEYEADGQGTARAWLKWQTQVTSAAAGGAVGWAKRLAAHPVIDRALAAGQLSCSWAKHMCAWTDRLPEAARDDADQILAEVAAGSAMGLRELAGLAEEMYQRTRPPAGSPDGDAERVFEDRQLRVGITFGGAGRAEGDLTPGCAHALTTVLDALGKKAGPEDTRTAGQRRHDALEEACQRLIRAGMVPGRAGQPTQLQVHMTLAQLLGLPGAGEAERAWIAARATTHDGWLTGPEAEAAACDATITPLVTGHLDPAALDRLVGLVQASHHTPATGQSARPGTRRGAGGPPGPARAGSPGGHSHAAHVSIDGRRTGPRAAVVCPVPAGGALLPTGPTGHGRPPTDHPPTDHPPTDHPPTDHPSTDHPPGATGTRPADDRPTSCSGAPAGSGGDLAPATRDRLRRALLGLAIQTLSGPGGLASHLRTTLTTPTPAGDGEGAAVTAATTVPAGPVPARAGLASISLPLDIGAATPTIPAHIRKAAGIRHRRCAFPGCRQPVSACDLHHLIPRSRGGPTSLANLVPLCQFHHLTAVHRWGWTLRLHADGTTTATSPDGSRVFHSHSPPGWAA
jgi:uncharacterized protein DUF222/HNH endonuclease